MTRVGISIQAHRVTTYQGTDGYITTSVSGGTAPYTYEWTKKNSAGAWEPFSDQKELRNLSAAGTTAITLLNDATGAYTLDGSMGWCYCVNGILSDTETENLRTANARLL